MKKWICLLCTLALACSLFSGVAVIQAPLAETVYADSTKYYNSGLIYIILANNTAEIVGYNDLDSTDIIIPSALEGHKVSAIGAKAFMGEDITSVKIPSTVKTIRSRAFMDCIHLETVTLPNSITTLGEYAFFGCTKLKSIQLPSELTKIGAAAFCSCKSLKSISIPDKVTALSNYLFSNCTSLTNVTLGSGVSSIPADVFYNCTALNKFTVSANNKTYSASNGVLFNKAKTKLIYYPFEKTDTVYTVPSTVKTIGDSAFMNSKYLVSVVLPSSVTSIGKEAFRYCASLKNVIMPNSVTNIGDCAFGDCPSLDNVTVSNKQTVIRDATFSNCYNLTTISIPKSVTEIAYCAFNECAILTDVYYGGSQSEWKSITFESYNTYLQNARIHYNSDIKPRLVILKQPKTVYVKNGATASVSLQAAGSGLTYKWYYKDKGASKYSFTPTFKGNSYSVTMTDTRAGRIVYCVVTDKYGRSVTTNKVALEKNIAKAAITKQPRSACAKIGSPIKVSLKASGEGLTYKWYYKNKGDTKYTYTSTFKGNSYETVMNNAKNGRIVYCVVTDKYGNKVTTNKVSLDAPVTITKQPKSVAVAYGLTARVTVKATGGGLTYKWYYKNKGDTKYTYTSTFTTGIYETSLTKSRIGRIVYCVITDKHGNKVTTNKVVLEKAVAIKTQPKSACVRNGKPIKVSVQATGVGLTYKWYYKNKGETKYSYTSSFKGNSYETVMNNTRAGRVVYCVITDKYGNSVTTNKVALDHAVIITKQPQSTSVPAKENAVVTVKASGAGLTYRWFYKEKGSDTFTYTSKFKSNSYIVPMNSGRDGRQVYCIVTDKYGYNAKSEVATISMK